MYMQSVQIVFLRRTFAVNYYWTASRFCFVVNKKTFGEKKQCIKIVSIQIFIYILLKLINYIRSTNPHFADCIENNFQMLCCINYF